MSVIFLEKNISHVGNPDSIMPVLRGREMRQYYFGLTGNAWYGLGENREKGTLDLIDTDCKIGNEECKTVWGVGADGAGILNYVNGMGDKLFNSADKKAVLSRLVTTDEFSPWGKGCLHGALLWAPSHSEFVDNRAVAGKISENAGGPVWSRTYYYNPDSFCGAWMVNNGKAEMKAYYTSSPLRVAPAFQVDSLFILLPKPASSAEKGIKMKRWGRPDKEDVKFLVDVGKEKSEISFKLIGKTDDNTFSFAYKFGNLGTISGCGLNFLSAIIYDNNGNILQYGNIERMKGAGGEVKVQIPEELGKGEYVLSLFQEERNPAMLSDYASRPISFRFEKK